MENMLILRISLVLLYFVCTLYGLYALKAYDFGMTWGYIIGFLAYALGFMIWLIVLKLYPLSVAFPIAAGGLIVGSQLVGYFALSDKLDLSRVIGVMLIILGILIISTREYSNE